MYTNLDHALRYADDGIAVFPVHYPTHQNGRVACSCAKKGACVRIGKHPATKHGYEDGTTDQETIRQLWRGRNYNIGAPCGGLFDVLDDDPGHGGDAALAALVAKHGPLPETITSRTGGGGFHFFFDHIEGVKNNNTGWVGDGLDFKTTGGYVVMPPSLHRSGNHYEWTNPNAKIVPAPGWLVELLREQFPDGSATEGPRRSSDFWAMLADGMTAGDRHNAIASVAGLLMAKNLNTRLVIRLIHGYNTECCDPPKSRGEVDAIITHILKKK